MKNSNVELRKNANISDIEILPEYLLFLKVIQEKSTAIFLTKCAETGKVSTP
jgi:hypothetical protein